MTLVQYSVKPGQKPTPEQIAEIERAAQMPIVYDEDCPELTEEELKRFKPIRKMRAWDPDFTKLTAKEREELEQARADDELISHEDINWD